MHQIHAEMSIAEILQTFPSKSQKLKQALAQAGLQCASCCSTGSTTLNSELNQLGWSAEEMSALIDHLNEIALEEQSAEALASITLTPKAAQKFQAILDDEGKSGWALRYGERMGGCRGMEYFLDYSQEASPNDTVFTSNGVAIHVETDSLDRLLGSQIDYVDGLQGSGFKISNPNVNSCCGCGNSHGY